jgi:hypothetical protein
MPYCDANGQEVCYRDRVALDGPDKIMSQTGKKQQPYGIHRLDEARHAGEVIVPEGESDTQTLWYRGFPALGLPGASSWQPSWKAHLDGIPKIYVIQEPDAAGAQFVARLAKDMGDRLWVVTLDGAKDPNDLYRQDPTRFDERLRAALDAAIPWVELERRRRADAAHEAFRKGRDILFADRPLDLLGEAAAQRGYAGDTGPVQLVYLESLTRLRNPSVNLLFLAPAGVGKSRTADEGLAFVPLEDVVAYSASSDMAAIYDDVDFTGKVWYLREADSFPSGGKAISLLRAITEVSDHKPVVDYATVEQDDHNHQVTIHRTITGPLQVITTSTKPLEAQMASRMLEVHLRDDPGHIGSIIDKVFEEDRQPPAVDVEPFQWAQRYVRDAGDTRVLVPFGPVLARQLPRNVARMTRAAQMLRALIEAHALLCQCRRERTPDGAIIATLDDYEAVRALVEPFFGSVKTGVPPAAREMARTIKEVQERERTETVTYAQLERQTGTHADTWRQRLSRIARRGSWIVNIEERRGFTARLTLGDELPDLVPGLPTVEDLRRACDVPYDLARVTADSALDSQRDATRDGVTRVTTAQPYLTAALDAA